MQSSKPDTMWYVRTHSGQGGAPPRVVVYPGMGVDYL